ncbi:MAG: 5-deoxy-glucuronate isomerase [Rhodospirillaceae bacterium]|nr:5-deoxy-glucuronate isomerase [Rhodospirillaceae bacterium]MBL6931591.1 5-deoxy-glucuronate isomerase [Rhodospirillales bacterium]
MSKLLCKRTGPDETGRVHHITPQSANWGYVGFDLYELAPGQSVANETADREVCLVMITGTATVTVGDQVFKNIGERQSVFEGKPPTAVYMPAGSTYSVLAETGLTLGVCNAPGKSQHPVRLISPDEMGIETRGVGANVRHVCNILPDTDVADSLLVVEVVTPGGNWSSYPPHRHDTDDLPTQSSLEETYYHRLNPAQGFAFQRVYTDDRSLDETMSVEDGDVVMVPKGYHPVGAPHGYDLYYLNVMAGPVREWKFHNDPDHDWIMNRPD